MQLIENWQETKEALLEGLSGSKKNIVSTLMENQRRVLAETAPANAVVSADVATFQKIMIPMIRRIIPGTIGGELVGVQPMTGPTGLIYSLRFAFAEAVDAPGTLHDITPGDEAFVYNGKMKRFYSSANVGTAGYPPALTATTSDGFAAKTEDYEGYGGRSMRLSVLKQAVTVGSRKLQARWTMEAAQDMSATHGIDIESELTAALAAEIAHEIDNEILTDLLALAGTTATYDFAAAPTGFNPTYIGDRYAELGILVNKMANEIGARTKRGPGNWLVGGHLITSLLQSGSRSVFAPAISGTFDAPTGNRLVGTLNGQMRVYTYNWGLNDNYDIAGGVNSAAGTAGEDILIGYKGGNSELDAGYFYCPYVPLMSTGVVMDANTFMPAVSLSTRYGKATFTNASTSFGNSADYYARILVKNVAFS
jgi:hypothetical protein